MPASMSWASPGRPLNRGMAAAGDWVSDDFFFIIKILSKKGAKAQGHDEIVVYGTVARKNIYFFATFFFTVSNVYVKMSSLTVAPLST